MKKNKKGKKIIIFTAGILLISLTFLILAVSGFAFSKSINYQLDETLFDIAKQSNITKIYYDKNGVANALSGYDAAVYEEISVSATKKEWVSYDKISDSLKNSFIAMEDRVFFEHSGIDVKRTVAAFLNYIIPFSKTDFGGSTITQQVIKNISGDNERSIKRKLSEILRALHIEYNHSKKEILEVYLNIVPLSENIVGVGEAAEAYFSKSASELNYAEAAMLVGIANAPTKYNPYKHPTECKEKRNRVLYSLYDCGYIDREYYELAKNQELGIKPKNTDNNSYVSWFSETVCKDLSQDFSARYNIAPSVAEKMIYSGGFHIYSTVVPEVQKIIEDYFSKTENFSPDVANGLEYSMVVSNHKNGNLLGIVGGVGKKSANRILNFANVNVIPGSTLKPIALYAPLINDKKINWATVFDDVPVTFLKDELGEYKMFPKNSPNVYDGLTTVKDALKVSKNTVAVRLYEMLGAEKIYSNLVENFGLTSIIKDGKNSDGTHYSDLSVSPLALGQLSKGVSLRKLTEAYNVFPNDGVLKKGRSYVAVEDSEGKLIFENLSTEKEVFTEETARIMNKLLEFVVEEGTAKGIKLRESIDTAGKTGTSGEDKDRLFIGYTPYISAGIWCGYKPQKKEIGKQNISHLEIWDNVMRQIHEKLFSNEQDENFSIDGLEYLPYCKDSGKLLIDECGYDPRGTRAEYGFFTRDNKPEIFCDRHVFCYYDSLTNGIAHEGCDSENIIKISLLKNYERSFPIEIIVSDAEFCWRDVPDGVPLGNSYEIPFFFYTLNPDEYVGRSKNKKQYNSSCYIHSD